MLTTSYQNECYVIWPLQSPISCDLVRFDLTLALRSTSNLTLVKHKVSHLTRLGKTNFCDNNSRLGSATIVVWVICQSLRPDILSQHATDCPDISICSVSWRLMSLFSAKLYLDKGLERWRDGSYSYSHIPIPSYLLNFALMAWWGGVVENLHRFFFSDYQKTAARSAAVFDTPYHTFLSAYVVKISDLGYARSSHQVTSSDLTS